MCTFRLGLQPKQSKVTVLKLYMAKHFISSFNLSQFALCRLKEAGISGWHVICKWRTNNNFITFRAQ